MAKEGRRYEVIHDEKAGLQLHDVESDMVADIAVLDHTWRKRGEEPVDTDPGEPEVKGQMSSVAGTSIRSYGGLQIRLSGPMPYAIKLKVAELRRPGP